MNRRTFLTRLTTGVIGVSLVNTEWIPTAITGELPAPATYTDIRHITACFLSEMTQGYLKGWLGQFRPGDYALGDGGMSDQLSISFRSELATSQDELIGRFIEPAARALAKKVQAKNLREFGALPMPNRNIDGQDMQGAVVMDESTGVAVRGVRVLMPYNPETDTPAHWIDRFDVLGKAA